MWILPANKYYQESQIPILLLPPRYRQESFHQVQQILSVYIPIKIIFLYDFEWEYLSLSALQNFYYHLQAPANPSHKYLSQLLSTHQWNLQLVKSRCSSIKAGETSEPCPGALPFPKCLVSLSKNSPPLHTPSKWDGFGVEGFQLPRKTKGRHIWQRSCKDVHKSWLIMMLLWRATRIPLKCCTQL